MNLAIVGGRDFNDYEFLKKEITNIISSSKENNINFTKIVSGAANGADKLGAKYAKEFGLELLEFPADWNTHGNAAGYIRNVDIITNADLVVAFWNGISKGTKHSIDIASKQNKQCIIIKY